MQLQLLVAGDHVRWLPLATKELTLTLDLVHIIELDRAQTTAELCQELGLPETASLKEIAQACGDPWAPIFQDHRLALLDAVSEIGDLASSTRSLIERNLQLPTGLTDALERARRMTPLVEKASTAGFIDQSA